jgi:hypothetical protein
LKEELIKSIEENKGITDEPVSAIVHFRSMEGFERALKLY